MVIRSVRSSGSGNGGGFSGGGRKLGCGSGECRGGRNLSGSGGGSGGDRTWGSRGGFSSWWRLAGRPWTRRFSLSVAYVLRRFFRSSANQSFADKLLVVLCRRHRLFAGI